MKQIMNLNIQKSQGDDECLGLRPKATSIIGITLHSPYKADPWWDELLVYKSHWYPLIIIGENMRHFEKQNALQVLTLNKHSSIYIMNIVGDFNMVGEALGGRSS